jgi:hypothetical protein
MRQLCFVRGNIYPLCFVVGVGEESIEMGVVGPLCLDVSLVCVVWCGVVWCGVASQFCIVIVIHALTLFVYTFSFSFVVLQAPE